MKTITEDWVEITVERAIDKLDRKLLNGTISQEEYDQEVFILDKWASQQFKYIGEPLEGLQ